MTDRSLATLQAPIEVIGQRFRDVEASKLKERDVEAFRNHLLEKCGLSKVTVARYLATLRAGCGGALSHVPIGKMISELKRVKPRVEGWTHNEVERIISTALGHSMMLHCMVTFFFATGCRRGEVLALQECDVDFDRRVINVRRSLALDGTTKDGTKWGGARTVPISDRLSPVLRSWFETKERGSNGDCRVFPSYTQRNLTRVFHGVLSNAGVRPFKLHCTRHTAISFALASGMSLRKASEIFGVAQQTLETHYAHFVPGEVAMDWL
jgi:integrase